MKMDKKSYKSPQTIEVILNTQLVAMSLNNEVSRKPAYGPSQGKKVWDSTNWTSSKD